MIKLKKLIKEEYFTFSKAKKLISINSKNLTDNQLQKHIMENK